MSVINEYKNKIYVFIIERKATNNYIYLYVNKSFSLLTGVEIRDFIGKPFIFSKYLDSTDKDCFSKILEDFYKSNKKETNVLHKVKYLKTDKIITLMIYIIRIKKSDKDLFLIIGIDFTKLVLLDNIVFKHYHKSPLGVIEWKLDKNNYFNTKVIVYNNKAEEILGYNKNYINNHISIFDLMTNGDKPKFLETIKSLLTLHNQTNSVKVKCLTNKDNEVLIRWNNVVLEESNTSITILSYLSDITKEFNLHQELDRLKLDKKISDKAIDKYLNRPLTDNSLQLLIRHLEDTTNELTNTLFNKDNSIVYRITKLEYEIQDMKLDLEKNKTDITSISDNFNINLIKVLKELTLKKLTVIGLILITLFEINSMYIYPQLILPVIDKMNEILNKNK